MQAWCSGSSKEEPMIYLGGEGLFKWILFLFRELLLRADAGERFLEPGATMD